MLTCRHVVNVTLTGECLAVYDNELNKLVPLSHILLPKEPDLDLAFIPNALNRKKSEFLPILSPEDILIGDKVYTYGSYAFGGQFSEVENGYFAGRIVSVAEPKPWLTFTLPFSVIEGLSGSAILTYHNGPKVVGIAIGNKKSRILAHKVIEFTNETGASKETIHRIVEFGVAYHAATLIGFLKGIPVSDIIVTNEQTNIPGME